LHKPRSLDAKGRLKQLVGHQGCSPPSARPAVSLLRVPTNAGSRHVNARPPSGCGFVDGAKKPRPQLHRSDTTARQFIDASLNPLKTRKRRKEEARPISTPATKSPLRLFCSAAPVSLTLERPLPIKVYPTGSFDESTDLLDQGMNSLLLAALVADSDDVAQPNRDDAATWFRDDVARCTGMISPTGAWPAGRRFLTFRP
jgi:hypothetical protein